MLYTEGNLYAEDRALRHIAREKVNSALAQVETKTARLVEQLVGEMDSHLSRKCTTDQLLNMVRNHESLQPERALISRYIKAFPELEERVLSRRERMLNKASARLREAFAPFEYARRYAHTKGLRPH